MTYTLPLLPYSISGRLAAELALAKEQLVSSESRLNAARTRIVELERETTSLHEDANSLHKRAAELEASHTQKSRELEFGSKTLQQSLKEAQARADLVRHDAFKHHLLSLTVSSYRPRKHCKKSDANVMLSRAKSLSGVSLRKSLLNPLKSWSETCHLRESHAKQILPAWNLGYTNSLKSEMLPVERWTNYVGAKQRSD